MMERTVGAALRGRPRLNSSISKTTASGLANTISNRGRPRRAAPTVRSELSCGLTGAVGGGLVPGWWIYAEKVSHKEIVAFVIAVRGVAIAAASAVIGAGNYE